MYSLPDAPPQSEWQSVEETPAESPEEAARRFLDAKRSAIQCYAALADSKWDEALLWISTDTAAFLKAHASDGSAATALADHAVMIDGKTLAFDPVADVFIADLVDIRDDFGDRKDDESAERKILYAVSASGEARSIAVVLDEDKWRVQFTIPAEPILKP